jgi:hypothetical protein
MGCDALSLPDALRKELIAPQSAVLAVIKWRGLRRRLRARVYTGWLPVQHKGGRSMSFLKYRSTLALLTVMSCGAAAQTENRTPIDIVGRPQGVLSERLVFELKEQLRGSQGLRLSSEAAYRVHIVGMDDEDGNFVVYSVVWTYKGADSSDVYSNSTVGLCGSQALSECARNVLASTDKMVADEAQGMADVVKDLLKGKPASGQTR